VALVPVESRRLAAVCLEAGADAWLPEPVDLRELAALVARGLSRAGTPSPPTAGGAAALAAEVAHAVGNPLQAASLLLETAEPASARTLAASVRPEVERIRRVVDAVGAFGSLGPPAPSPTDLGPLLAERLAALASEGVVAAEATAGGAPVVASADSRQVGLAFDATLRFLAARSPDAPARASGVVRRATEEGPAVAEAAVRVRGVHLKEADLEGALGSVLWTDDRTRACHPGLALPHAVAVRHGGGLLARETPVGTALALRLPLA
jgi:hypothetical protein